MKITKITSEQAARFGEWTKKWIDIGLSTKPANFNAATKAALKAYKLCSLEKPQVILHVGSPYAATVGGAMAWDFLRRLGSQVESRVGSRVGSQVESQVNSQVESQVRSQVGSQVESQVGSQVKSQVKSQVNSQIKHAIYNECYGALWSGWCAYISFLRDVLEWKDPILTRFAIEEVLAKSCGWVWWHENVLAISDRPKELHRDNAGLLHSIVGPSISYRDGWSLYHVHGVSVPGEWITQKDKLDPSLALTHKNVEQRRALAELIGWDKILNNVKAKELQRDEFGVLLSATLPGSGKSKFVRVVCGTGRTFVLPVPVEIKTAREAVSWSYGIGPNEYKPEVRT